MSNPVDELLRRKGDKSLRDIATEIGVTAPYIHDIINGRRTAGPKVLKYLGLRRIEQPKKVRYEALK